MIHHLLAVFFERINHLFIIVSDDKQHDAKGLSIFEKQSIEYLKKDLGLEIMLLKNIKVKYK